MCSLKTFAICLWNVLRSQAASRRQSSHISYLLSLLPFFRACLGGGFLSLKASTGHPPGTVRLDPSFYTRYSLRAYGCRLPEPRGSSWPPPSSPRSSRCQPWSLPLPYITACNSLVPPWPGQAPTRRDASHHLALLCGALTSGTELHEGRAHAVPCPPGNPYLSLNICRHHGLWKIFPASTRPFRLHQLLCKSHTSYTSV